MRRQSEWNTASRHHQHVCRGCFRLFSLFPAGKPTWKCFLHSWWRFVRRWTTSVRPQEGPFVGLASCPQQEVWFRWWQTSAAYHETTNSAGARGDPASERCDGCEVSWVWLQVKLLWHSKKKPWFMLWGVTLMCDQQGALSDCTWLVGSPRRLQMWGTILLSVRLWDPNLKETKHNKKLWRNTSWRLIPEFRHTSCSLTHWAWRWDRGRVLLWSGCSCAWSRPSFAPTRTENTEFRGWNDQTAIDLLSLTRLTCVCCTCGFAAWSMIFSSSAWSWSRTWSLESPNRSMRLGRTEDTRTEVREIFTEFTLYKLK